jgi:lysophospholipase L1-like esterase
LIHFACAAVAVTATGQAALTGQRSAADSAVGWVTAWSTSQQALGEASVTNATVRLIARVTVPGDAVRLRLDNTFGADAVRIGRAFVGLRVQGAQIAAGSNRSVTFNRAVEVTLPPGASVSSDPVPLKVLAQQDLAVSLYLPGAAVRPSQHANAVVTSYRTADGAGDAAANEGRTPFATPVTSTWWLKAIDVQAAAASGTIVAFGDSITDGTCTTLDAHDRWVDLLSVRLGLEYEAARARPGAHPRLKAVVNEGIGGNTVTRDGLSPAPDSPPGLERLERDVLSHTGVTDVILFMGTNDVRRDGSVEQIERGLAQIVRQVKAKGLRIAGVTMIPRHNVAPSGTNTGWNAEKTRRRNEINQWIRTQAGFDAVLDFDAAVRDPQNPDAMQPPFNCGDGIHPSPIGYNVLGRSIPLSVFTQ